SQWLAPVSACSAEVDVLSSSQLHAEARPRSGSDPAQRAVPYGPAANQVRPSSPPFCRNKTIMKNRYVKCYIGRMQWEFHSSARRIKSRGMVPIADGIMSRHSTELAVQVVGGADQRQVGKRLGEAAELLTGRPDLLRVEPDVVRVGEHLLESQPRL